MYSMFLRRYVLSRIFHSVCESDQFLNDKVVIQFLLFVD